MREHCSGRCGTGQVTTMPAGTAPVGREAADGVSPAGWHRGVDRAGAHDVDGNAGTGQLGGQAEGVRLQAPVLPSRRDPLDRENRRRRAPPGLPRSRPCARRPGIRPSGTWPGSGSVLNVMYVPGAALRAAVRAPSTTGTGQADVSNQQVQDRHQRGKTPGGPAR
jgi:hypothetical protein